jgi:hypothetical protein
MSLGDLYYGLAGVAPAHVSGCTILYQASKALEALQQGNEHTCEFQCESRKVQVQVRLENLSISFVPVRR